MRYREPEPLTVADAQPLVASDDPDVVRDALVRIVHSPLDPAWIEAQLLDATRADDPAVRGTAATCLGHLARIHGRVSTKKALPALRRLLKDPATAGVAEDALEDIQLFSKRP